VLKITEELYDHCPQFRMAQVSRANALNKLQRWTTAKEYIENIICTTHNSVLRLHSHSTHTTKEMMEPTLSAAKLAWTDAGKNAVNIDRNEIMRALYIMGGELAAVYIVALKNVVAARTCCSDVMNKVMRVMISLKDQLHIHGGNNGMGNQSSGYDWAWVEGEFNRLKSIIDAKERADQFFKDTNFTSAISCYGAAMKSDPSAFRWAAVLHSNRAAAFMSLNMFQDAVNDCNSAAAKDPGYNRAYLRRARALRGLNKFADAVRDFRKYLHSVETTGLHSHTPQTAQQAAELSDVEAELQETIEMQSRHIRAEQLRQQRERFESESQFRSRNATGGSGRGAGGRGHTRNFFTNFEEDEDDGFFTNVR
jgi:hypothetical protein